MQRSLGFWDICPKMSGGFFLWNTLYISRTVDHIRIFGFLVHRCKIMVSPCVFLFFFWSATLKFWHFLLAHVHSFLDKKLLSSSSINAKQILRCAQPSSHVWDFFYLVRNRLKISLLILSELIFITLEIMRKP